MKSLKIIQLLTIATLCFTPKIAAQQSQRSSQLPVGGIHRHEVFVGYGRFVISGANHGLFRLYLDDYYEIDATATEMIMVGYKYRFGKTIFLGGTYSLGLRGGNAHHKDSERYDTQGNTRTRFHTLAVECDFRYLTRPLVTLYSTVGAAVTYWERHVWTNNQTKYPSAKKREAFPNYHVSAIGVKFGEHRLGGWVELGAGYKGLISFGAYTRF